MKLIEGEQTYWCEKCEDFVAPRIKRWETSIAIVEDTECIRCGEVLPRVPRKVFKKEPVQTKCGESR